MKAAWDQRLLRALAAVWLGGLLWLAAGVAPTAFAELPRSVAGALMGRLFAIEAAVSCGLALFTMMLLRRRSSRAEPPGPSITPEVLLAAGALFVTVAGHYGLAPAMQQARAGAGALSFGALHAISMGFFAIKVLLVAALVWRAR